jgi:hypothetical protein
MMVVAKFHGRWVQVMRFATSVGFSNVSGWFMICMDWEQAERKKSQFKWVPASTVFDEVKEFVV